jgi:hypothetical protein
MTISMRWLHAAGAGRFLHSPVQFFLSVLGALHIVYMMLVAVVAIGQLFQTLGCRAGGLSFSCLHQQDALLLPMALLSVWLAGQGAGLLSSNFRRTFVPAEISWALLLTWYAWFSLESPLRPHELQLAPNESGFSSGKALALYAPRLAVYLALITMGAYPLLARRLGALRALHNATRRQNKNPSPIVRSSSGKTEQ